MNTTLTILTVLQGEKYSDTLNRTMLPFLCPISSQVPVEISETSILSAKRTTPNSAICS